MSRHTVSHRAVSRFRLSPSSPPDRGVLKTHVSTELAIRVTAGRHSRLARVTPCRPLSRLALLVWLTIVGVVCWPSTGSDAALLGCEISTAAVPFGNYNVFSSNDTDQTGSVSYNCFLAVSVNVRINLSRGSAPTFSPRQMKNGSNTLNYNLFRDAGRGTVWGDGTSGTSFFQVSVLPLLGTSGTVTVFGRVFAQQDAAIGSYSDSVVATVVF
jgi:spore coat protein U-like protein